jgi:hypothetical protein
VRWRPCLRDRERNWYEDSDWDMLVWNPEKQEPEWINFASTRGWSYPSYGSRPGATPEVQTAYDEHRRNKQDEAARKAHQDRLDAYAP